MTSALTTTLAKSNVTKKHVSASVVRKAKSILHVLALLMLTGESSITLNASMIWCYVDIKPIDKI